jgi:hypothetical protein
MEEEYDRELEHGETANNIANAASAPACNGNSSETLHAIVAKPLASALAPPCCWACSAGQPSRSAKACGRWYFEFMLHQRLYDPMRALI